MSQSLNTRFEADVGLIMLLKPSEPNDQLVIAIKLEHYAGPSTDQLEPALKPLWAAVPSHLKP